MIDSMFEILGNINVIFYIIAYLLGGLPIGVIIVKIFANKNLLEIGSKSSGATNVYRAFADIDIKKAKLFSLITLILDAIKGLLVVLLAKLVGLDYATQYTIAFLSIIGHCYSPFLGFYGGKGVSTAIGSVLLLVPIEGVLGLLVWGVVGKFFKVSSLSSLFGVISGIIFTFIIPSVVSLPESIDINTQIGTHVPVVLIGLLIIYTHTDNIIRLIAKKEQKILS
ncbi:glycerol-3-phosphate 1-O-acyltransferase PlsY [Helicobacter muridarum]|uniref:Glycerol-3-phosphate acyltransferase n=1 Tax=Helicobacter muridarum TaxID=216 RepID=A0A099TZX3_9HELI|nr:glycerol-3-phosphate 1-O-acyltransferase PlsY [Helicobacter muridarum]TLD99763.1 glycerol-3-phosphate 1-O-acyltransferase PlsY [Helicobacter muridarum]STQ87005.1 glycerol-3-phosphate acyltransferase PlsY [Helicobacter muridarum]